MQVLNETGDIRWDAKLMNWALHARNILPTQSGNYLRSSSSV
jgi:hypothetical protein